MDDLRLVLWKAGELSPLMEEVRVIPISGMSTRGYFMCYLEADDDDCYVKTWYAPADINKECVRLDPIPEEGTPASLRDFGVNLDEIGWVVHPQDLDIAQCKLRHLNDIVTGLRRTNEEVQL